MWGHRRQHFARKEKKSPYLLLFLKCLQPAKDIPPVFPKVFRSKVIHHSTLRFLSSKAMASPDITSDLEARPCKKFLDEVFGPDDPFSKSLKLSMASSPQCPQSESTDFWSKTLHPRVYTLVRKLGIYHLWVYQENKNGEYIEGLPAHATKDFFTYQLHQLGKLYDGSKEAQQHLYASLVGDVESGLYAANASTAKSLGREAPKFIIDKHQREEIFGQYADLLSWCPECDKEGQYPEVWYHMRYEAAWGEHREKHERERDGYDKKVQMLRASGGP